MTGRKKKRLKSVSASVRDDKKTTKSMRCWSDLPAELLELIISGFSLKENVRVSAVCKRWHAIAISVQLVNKPPWIMFLPKNANLHEFYDPVTRKTRSIELPEVRGCRVMYTRGSWLLLSRPHSPRSFFFNPYSRELIELPRFELCSQGLAFSCDPTSPDCIVFTMKQVNPTIVAISTCHPGATEWTTFSYQNRVRFVSSFWNKLVFSNGQFYCLSFKGWLGVFDPEALTWDVLDVSPPRCPRNFNTKNWWKGSFIAEHDGDILVMYTWNSACPVTFKLNQEDMVWEEVESLDGLALFASFLSSHSRSDLPGIMRNNVYFSKVRFYGKQCISYSFKDRRYYPQKQLCDWGEQDPSDSVWVDAPHDLSVFM